MVIASLEKEPEANEKISVMSIEENVCDNGNKDSTEQEKFCCPIEDCPKHVNGYANKGGLTKHMNNAHPNFQE